MSTPSIPESEWSVMNSRSPRKRSGWAIGLGMIALLVTSGVAKAEEAVPQKAVEKAERLEGAAYITKKLETIVIPRIDADKVPLAELVDLLRLKVAELDVGEKDPRKKGINFVIRAHGGPDILSAPVTLRKKDVRLVQVVKDIADQAGLGYAVDDFTVTFSTFEDLKAAAVARNKGPVNPTPAINGKAYDFAQKVIIPSVEFENATLRQAVDFPNQKARELTKDGPVYAIAIDPSVETNDKRIKEMRLRNIPLSQVLRFCADQFKCALTADDKELRLSGF